jgi:membrane-bound serine protease (ClpP class)
MELSILLLVLGLALMTIEIFIPGLIVGVLGAGLAVAAIVIAFRIDPLLGWLEVASLLVIVPALLILALRRLALKAEIREEPSPPRPSLLGHRGRVVTDLKPSGYVFIDGIKVLASAVTGYIEKGRPVKVIQVYGERVLVQEE